MANKRLTNVAVWAVAILVICVLLTFQKHRAYDNAYKTGIYIGKASFEANEYQNRRCLSFRADSPQRVCEVIDLNQDSAMEDALASANIVPSVLDSTALHTGFRDGWREARTAAFANR